MNKQGTKGQDMYETPDEKITYLSRDKTRQERRKGQEKLRKKTQINDMIQKRRRDQMRPE